MGLQFSKITTSPMSHMMDDMDVRHRRPKKQWWMQLQRVLQAVSDQPGPRRKKTR